MVVDKWWQQPFSYGPVNSADQHDLNSRVNHVQLWSCAVLHDVLVVRLSIALHISLSGVRCAALRIAKSPFVHKHAKFELDLYTSLLVCH